MIETDTVSKQSKSEELKFTCEEIYGHVELRQFYKPVENGIACYGYKIDFDKNGIEKSRSTPELLSILIIEDLQ